MAAIRFRLNTALKELEVQNAENYGSLLCVPVALWSSEGSLHVGTDVSGLMER